MLGGGTALLIDLESAGSKAYGEKGEKDLILKFLRECGNALLQGWGHVQSRRNRVETGLR